MTDAETPLPCRTCGRPRGENVADGTRCAPCGHKHAAVVWLLSGVAALNWSLYYDIPMSAALVAAIVTLLVVPVAFTAAVLIHELVHAAAAALLKQTVTRIVVGEGRALVRLGRDPLLVFGSVLLSNGITLVMDPRLPGYRRRWSVTLLSAPLVSLAIGLIVWQATEGWPLQPRTAALVFAVANLLTAVITLIPVPAFGGRVWSDLATTRYLWRATDEQVREHQLLGVQDRLAHLLELDRPQRAVELARVAADAHPTSTLARSLLAYTLYRVGERAEATSIARAALVDATDEGSRSYLARLLEEAAG